jgi:hypothetical protein
MAGRDALEDATLDRLIRDLSLAPLADRAVGAYRDLTGQRSQLAELLGGKVSGRSGTGPVAQPGGHAGRRVGVGRCGGQPAPTPETRGIEADRFVSGNLGVVFAVSGGQDDASP